MAGVPVILGSVAATSVEPFHLLLSLNPWSPDRAAESFRTDAKSPRLREYRSSVCSVNEGVGSNRYWGAMSVLATLTAVLASCEFRVAR
ncbi:MAG: hypothetical protein JWP80_2823 [Pseudomonas sp.]|nr:hypothetical protein [Pseudomonas sp.]